MQNFIRNTIQSQKIFYRYFRRKGWKRFLKENILETDGSNKTKAFSIALGVFIGISPFWGLHSFLAITLSVYFKLNKFLTFISSQITFPPLVPFIIAASLMIGKPFVDNQHINYSEFNFELIKNNLAQYIIGSLILAIFCAVFFGFTFYFILKKLYPEK